MMQVVPLDGVGGAAILIRSALHMEGVRHTTSSLDFEMRLDVLGIPSCSTLNNFVSMA